MIQIFQKKYFILKLLFTGHVNEKNFVGLATDGDYITCGSENNGLYIYYKGEMLYCMYVYGFEIVFKPLFIFILYNLADTKAINYA